jgi:hypothetical protein
MLKLSSFFSSWPASFVILSPQAKDLLVRANFQGSGGSDGPSVLGASRRRTIVAVLDHCCGRRSFASRLRMTKEAAQTGEGSDLTPTGGLQHDARVRGGSIGSKALNVSQPCRSLRARCSPSWLEHHEAPPATPSHSKSQPFAARSSSAFTVPSTIACAASGAKGEV